MVYFGMKQSYRVHVPNSGRRPVVFDYAVSFSIVVVVSLISFGLTDHFGYQAVSLFLLFSVALLSLFLSVGAIVAAAVMSALIWNFFFIPPQFTLAIHSTQDALLFSSYFVIAVITGILTNRVRVREKNARALYSLTKELITAATRDEVVRAAVRNVETFFSADVLFYVGTMDGKIDTVPHPASTFVPDTKEFAVASWVYRNERKGGKDEEILPYAECTFYPLLGPRYPLGVLGIRTEDAKRIDPDREVLLQNFIAQISSALEREQLNELTQRAVILEESEKLYRTLFSSISHELRTPIAAIISAAEALTQRHQQEFLDEIHTAADRLNRLVENLLDMTRLESGQLAPRLDWCDVNDLFRTSAHKMKKELASHTVTIVVPESMPFIRLDFGLMEQVFVNLLYNASLYTPAGSTITLSARMEEKNCLFTVEDNGPGFPADALIHLFNKFYRVPGSRSGGTGLGLSIVKGYVEAHQGTISAANRPSGGAVFNIVIPTETHSTTLS